MFFIIRDKTFKHKYKYFHIHQRYFQKIYISLRQTALQTVMSIVSYVHCPLCPLSIMSIVRYVHCPLCPLSVMSIVCYVHCLLCPLPVIFSFIMSIVQSINVYSLFRPCSLQSCMTEAGKVMTKFTCFSIQSS